MNVLKYDNRHSPNRAASRRRRHVAENLDALIDLIAEVEINLVTPSR